jgi:hypothetical protein
MTPDGESGPVPVLVSGGDASAGAGSDRICIVLRPSGNVVLRGLAGELVAQRADLVDLIELLVKAHNDHVRVGGAHLILVQVPTPSRFP